MYKYLLVIIQVRLFTGRSNFCHSAGKIGKPSNSQCVFRSKKKKNFKKGKLNSVIIEEFTNNIVLLLWS